MFRLHGTAAPPEASIEPPVEEFQFKPLPPPGPESSPEQCHQDILREVRQEHIAGAVGWVAWLCVIEAGTVSSAPVRYASSILGSVAIIKASRRSFRKSKLEIPARVEQIRLIKAQKVAARAAKS